MRPKSFCLIGHPVNHSLSPIIHNYFIYQTKINAGYICLDIKGDKLKSYIDFIKENFDGFNVTVPYKERILSYLDEVDDEADKINAVNCAKKINGRLKGFNTDIYGIKKTFEIYNIDLNGKNILVIGSGGASRPLFHYIKNFNYSTLDIVNRTVNKAENLIKQLKLKNAAVFQLEYLEKNLFYDIIINTSSIGLKGKWPYVMNVKAKEFVFDMQYNLTCKTAFLSLFDNEQFCDGKIMLIYQAVKSFEIWNDVSVKFDLNKLLKFLRG